jgi:hypothetical protein
MLRFLLIVHRYTGIAIGLVMLLWCLSGFVMIYQGYPRLSEAERLRGLAPLRFGAPAVSLALPDDGRLSGFRVLMQAGRPILLADAGFGALQRYDLASGALLDAADEPVALAVARDFAAGHALPAGPRSIALIDDDQWSIEAAAQSGPLYRVALGDPARTELYVAQSSGESVQVTTRHVRFWSWLGAVPHWLYPTALRRHVALWNQVVVWCALAGTFLTVTGLYVGIVVIRRAPLRWSPYRGWSWWHHLAGLCFGVLTLTWVASGLLTMNPWGFLDSPAGFAEREQLRGGISGAQVRQFLAGATALPMRDIVLLQAEPLDGSLFVVATDRDGRRLRLDADAHPAPLTGADLGRALREAGIGPVRQWSMQTQEDAYYYGRYERTASLPVHRAELADAAHTVLYLDTVSGALLEAIDDTARQSRWLRTGLHDFDFARWLRIRPLWDVVVLLLLSGVSAVCATGAWLAIRRATQDLRRLRPRNDARSRTQ